MSPRQTIPTDKFLLIAMNLLHRHFIGAGRTQAKRLYRELREGRTVPITRVIMEDESTVRFRLSLDHSEFAGDLNFSAFRGGLSVLLANIARALQDKREVTLFSAEQRTDSLLFGITGMTVEDDRPNVLALGADTREQAGAITLKLMYLDPAQFTRPDEVATQASGENRTGEKRA